MKVKRKMECEMAMAKFYIPMVATILANGRRIKWMDLVLCTIPLVKKLIREIGKKISFMEREWSIMIIQYLAILPLIILILIKLMKSGLSMKENSEMMLRRE